MIYKKVRSLALSFFSPEHKVEEKPQNVTPRDVLMQQILFFLQAPLETINFS